MEEARIIAAGDPYRSVLMYRMSKLGYARMPYIGSNVVDSFGVSLIEQWIRSLPMTAADGRSAPLIPGSAEAKALEVLNRRTSETGAGQEAVRQLTATTSGSLALAGQLHAGKLSAADREFTVETVRSAGSDIRGLFDHFLPESQRKKTLGRTFDATLVTELDGDAQRGRLIFFSDAARCRTCHHTDDPAQSVGPTLTDISRKYAQVSEMLQHIQDPSLKIDERYATWTAVTEDGRIVNGLMAEQTDQQVTLTTAERRQVTIQRDEIEELLKGSRSLMPDSVLADLTAQEAADLLAFIRSMPKSGE